MPSTSLLDLGRD